MEEEKIDPTKGLPQELFLFATTLMPCPNVDLFITRGKQLLLSWRDDEFYGSGWHIPGGCIRLRETLDYRIQETAKKEVGVEVTYDKEHFLTREGIVRYERPWMENQLVRSHNISMLFYCTIPEEYQIENVDKTEHSQGYRKWFDHYPDELIEEHKVLYGDIIKKFFEGVLT